MNSPHPQTPRHRAGLNPLLTSSLGSSSWGNHVSTPMSSISMSSYSQTPASTVQPYNPQEWLPSLAPSSERNQQYQEAQPSPLPPPPYSPPRSQRPVSMHFDTPLASSSAARVPLVEAHRPSPEPQSSFPPPPGTSGRGSSRERRFGLPSFGRRRDTETNSPPHPHPPSVAYPSAITSRHRPTPLSVQVPHQVEQSPVPGLPPASRRAASAGAIETPTSARSRSASQSRWGPGMPVPPPPPGPPPTGSRSQSMTRTSPGSEPIVSPPTRRPPPSGVLALGPVPPTPANWVDTESGNKGNQQDDEHTPESDAATGESSNAVSSDLSAEPPAVPTSAGLSRARAVRGEKTLRERRNESRTRSARNSIDGAINSLGLSDIMIPPSGSGLVRRLTVNKSTPRSGGRSNQDTPKTGDMTDETPGSRGSTPRPLGSAQKLSQHSSAPTPPFSPQPQKPSTTQIAEAHIAPKALPTPPPQARSTSNSQTRLSLETLAPAQSTPSRLVTKQSVISQTADQFSQATVERFQTFAQREASASTDAERVRLFAEFIVSESRVRRERYSAAINAMGSEIFDLTRDLFRPMMSRRESTTSISSEFTPQSSESTRSHRGSIGSVISQSMTVGRPSSAPASASVPISPSGPPPNNANWSSTNYMPSLSPILSMSVVSENHDESGSRGRPASRWWETDSNGTPSGVERSKRESKYMGVSKETLEALQWVDDPDSVAGPSTRNVSNSEYPPEKVGWHDQDQASTPQLPLRNSLLSSYSAPNTSSPYHLDCSRLVTLPPPYPRHHPAVNNNHPDLTSTRASTRTLSDLADAEAIKETFKNERRVRHDEAAEAVEKRKKTLRENLSKDISSGNMSYAEAAAIEADAKEAEIKSTKDLDKTDFDRFQTNVVMPVNDLLTASIAKATELFNELRSRLFVETNQHNPNMPQEEGDEQPELLEKLTLLKWIFETREMLYRAVFDLLTERNDMYRDMVLTPYKLAGNAEKLAGAEAFFAEDAVKRSLAFSEEALQRTQEFRDVVEENVVRGVEVQLSAFWDIAPPLTRLLDKIPTNLEGFCIQIPPAEFAENPSYVDHPLQYLFSLLLHAEKSTYQFIESQTNLLCLLHEVKEAVVTARAKAVEQRGGRDAGRRADQARAEELARLTEDLKEKVRVVQGQWNDALGEGVQRVKERVGEWLLEHGGWDESLEDGGVGGV